MKTDQPVSMFGLAAEFEDDRQLLKAVRQARAAGYEDINAYTPYYVEGLTEAMGKKQSNINYFLVLIGLAVGALLGFWLQYWTDVINYPINVGGRPFNSWPAFLIITFEAAILFAALTAVAVLFLRSGLPLPYHPIFNAPNIELASSERFFLVVRVQDRNFQLRQTREFLQSLDPVSVSEVPG